MEQKDKNNQQCRFHQFAIPNLVPCISDPTNSEQNRPTQNGGDAIDTESYSRFVKTQLGFFSALASANSRLFYSFMVALVMFSVIAGRNCYAKFLEPHTEKYCLHTMNQEVLGVILLIFRLLGKCFIPH